MANGAVAADRAKALLILVVAFVSLGLLGWYAATQSTHTPQKSETSTAVDRTPKSKDQGE